MFRKGIITACFRNGQLKGVSLLLIFKRQAVCYSIGESQYKPKKELRVYAGREFFFVQGIKKRLMAGKGLLILEI